LAASILRDNKTGPRSPVTFYEVLLSEKAIRLRAVIPAEKFGVSVSIKHAELNL
jgi:hypothetical protein